MTNFLNSWSTAVTALLRYSVTEINNEYHVLG